MIVPRSRENIWPKIKEAKNDAKTKTNLAKSRQKNQGPRGPMGPVSFFDVWLLSFYGFCQNVYFKSFWPAPTCIKRCPVLVKFLPSPVGMSLLVGHPSVDGSVSEAHLSKGTRPLQHECFIKSLFSLCVGPFLGQTIIK